MSRPRAAGGIGSPAGRRQSPLARRGSEDAEPGRQRGPASRFPQLPPRAESPIPEQRTPPTQPLALMRERAESPREQRTTPPLAHRDALRTSQRGTPPPEQRQAPPPDSPPFPRIRGTQLERLFFSAPEHNERTCTTCCRRTKVRNVRDDRHEPERARERERAGWRLGGSAPAREDDEGYVEGDDELDIDPRRPPPQTVLVKVVRELEDDFAHYKA
jgi:hypothetical protein